jgi:PKD repeat protein
LKSRKKSFNRHLGLGQRKNLFKNMKRQILKILALATLFMSSFVACEDPVDGTDDTNNQGQQEESLPASANFTYSGNNLYPPCKVTFNNLSENATSYYWDFGDGKNSSSTNPNHTYTEGGTYSVTLKAFNSVGNDVMTKTVKIKNKPTKMKITKVELINYPLYDGNGNNWDLLDGAPDIYFKILNGNNNVIFESGYYDGLTLNQLPVNYTSDLPFTIENAFNQRCTIEFWDYDNDFDGDEWMGGYYFTPSQQDFNKNVIHLQSSTSDLELKMYVTWLE